MGIRANTPATPVTASSISVNVTTEATDGAVVARIWFGANGRVLDTATLDGVGADLIVESAGTGGWQFALAIWLNPGALAAVACVATLDGADNIDMDVLMLTSVGAVLDSEAVTAAGGNSSGATLTTEDGGFLVGGCHKQVDSALTVVNMTEDVAQAASQAGGRKCAGSLDTDGASESVQWHGGVPGVMPNSFAAAYVSFEAGETGPVVDVEPEAAFAIAGPAHPSLKTAMFAVVVSDGTAPYTYEWQEATTIGGVYSALEDDDENEGVDDDLLFVSPENVARNGNFVRCRIVDDDDQEVISAPAELTVYAGAALVDPLDPTNGAGLIAAEVESDVPCDLIPGSYVRVPASCEGAEWSGSASSVQP